MITKSLHWSYKITRIKSASPDLWQTPGTGEDPPPDDSRVRDSHSHGPPVGAATPPQRPGEGGGRTPKVKGSPIQQPQPPPQQQQQQQQQQTRFSGSEVVGGYRRLSESDFPLEMGGKGKAATDKPQQLRPRGAEIRASI